jgi:acyl carrier protein
VPIEVPGELHIAGAGLARGYLHRPDLTAEKFIPDPFSTLPGARLYKTGDLARFLPHGEIEFLGRIDHQVKLRGFRIELGEIDGQLQRHPEVRQAITIVRKNHLQDEYLAAYIVPQQKPPPAADSLRTFLRTALPDYMIPARFVFLEQMPVSPHGKVDRKALPEPVDESSPREEFVAPRTPMERRMAEIWCQVLGRTTVGIRDNFFELGGHSLLLTRIVARIRDEFQVDLPVAKFFQGPTIEQLVLSVQATQVEKRGWENINAILDNLENMSDDEVEQALRQSGPEAG